MQEDIYWYTEKKDKSYEDSCMCGILGGNIKNWNYEKGVKALRHRGPDGQRVVYYDGWTMAFARLAVMDLSEDAMQPMATDDGNVVLVFNGEIYGFQNLRNELKRKYHFKTTSDTEVILYSYMEYGDKFIDYIDGMFAIAIYDKRIEQIKLYRDRYGIKPLYYYYIEDRFAFSSELKGLIAACDNKWKFEIDNTAIYDYLAYQYIPEPKSMYKNIYKLEPASFIFYDVKKSRIIRKGNYWHLKVNTRSHGKRKKEVILNDLREMIANSVKDQMLADVPVGTFLSGGVDSSIISYECKRINPDIESFTIGFEQKSSDESKYAIEIASHCSLNSNVKMISHKDVEAVKGQLMKLYDEPFADTSAYPTLILSKYARNKVTVALTGDGGDELFGGYERYRLFFERRKNKYNSNESIEQILNQLLRESTYIKRKIMNVFESPLTTYSGLVGIFDVNIYKKWKKELEIDDDYDVMWYLKKYYHSELPSMTRMRYLDFKTYLPSDIFTKVDRASMSVSLETRIPFMSRKLVEYVFNLAENECCYGCELKALLKEAYENILPKNILYRKKKGFSVPNSYVSAGKETIYANILREEWSELENDIFKKEKKKIYYYN